MDQQGIDVVSVCALRPITLCLFLSVSQMNTLIWSLPPLLSVCLFALPLIPLIFAASSGSFSQRTYTTSETGDELAELTLISPMLL